MEAPLARPVLDDGREKEELEIYKTVDRATDGDYSYEGGHEIEGVFYHIRDEGYKDEPEDLWHENIVILSTICLHVRI